jgi:hypothetical protein
MGDVIMNRIIFICNMLLLVGAHSAFAFTAPDSGSVAGPIYTFFIEEVLGGFGMIAAICLIITGVVFMLKNSFFMVAFCLVGAGMIYFAEEMATAIGAMYPFI